MTKIAVVMIKVFNSKQEQILLKCNVNRLTLWLRPMVTRTLGSRASGFRHRIVACGAPGPGWTTCTRSSRERARDTCAPCSQSKRRYFNQQTPNKILKLNSLVIFANVKEPLACTLAKIIPAIMQQAVLMEQHTFENLNNCLNTLLLLRDIWWSKFESILFKCSFFSTRELLRNLWELKAAVFMHWCLLRGVPLPRILGLCNKQITTLWINRQKGKLTIKELIPQKFQTCPTKARGMM